MMRLAVSTYSLGRWRREQGKSLEHCIDWIADMGVAAVEFAGLDERVETIGPIRRAAQLRRRCEKRGLEVAGYNVGAELLVPPRTQRAAVRRLKLAVDTAAALGAPSMRHDVTRGWEKAGRLPGPRTFTRALRVVVPAVREVADHGRARDVLTTVENHGFYVQASRRVERLIKAVDHPGYALTLDMGNFLCVNEDPVEAVRRLVRYAAIVHVKDFHIKAKRSAPAEGWFSTPTSIALRGAIVGHGRVDVPTQLKILKRAGYHGFLSLEFEGLEEPTTGIRLGLDFLHRCEPFRSSP